MQLFQIGTNLRHAQEYPRYFGRGSPTTLLLMFSLAPKASLLGFEFQSNLLPRLRRDSAKLDGRGIARKLGNRRAGSRDCAKLPLVKRRPVRIGLQIEREFLSCFLG